MDWGKIVLNLFVMIVFFGIGYGTSYFFSKKYAMKKAKEESEKNEKQK